MVTAPKVEEEDESKPQLTEAERAAQREKAILYLRHRLQKGFLSRDQAPQESEMAGMADFFTQLETYENLEPSIIRLTKIHKVLKAIVKLASVPKDDEYNFKKRSSVLLDIWNRRMEADGDAVPQSAVDEKKPNGETEPSSEAPVETKEVPSIEEPKEGAEKETDDKTGEKMEVQGDGAAEATAASVEVTVTLSGTT